MIRRLSKLAAVLSLAAAALSVPAQFVIEDTGVTTPGALFQMALGPSEQVGIAYNQLATGSVKYAWRNAGGGWTSEVVGPGDLGPSIAFGPDGNPSLSFNSGGKLQFLTRINSNWSTTTIETKNVDQGTSLAFDAAGNPCIAYTLSGSLKFAKRVSGSWQKQVVETVKNPVYVRMPVLAFNTQSQPCIAYSLNTNRDIALDTLRLARYSGSAWTTETVASLIAGNTMYWCTGLAFLPSGAPVIASRNVLATGSQLNVHTFDGSWRIDSSFETAAGYVSTRNLSVGANGHVYLGFGVTGGVRVLDGYYGAGGWTWAPYFAEYGSGDPVGTPIAINPTTGLPGFAYLLSGSVWYAR